MKFRNEAERLFWEQVATVAITDAESDWRLVCGIADRLVEAQRDRCSELHEKYAERSRRLERYFSGSTPSQGASPSVPVEPKPLPSPGTSSDSVHPVYEEAQKMLVSDGPFGDVTEQVVAEERRHMEHLKWQRGKFVEHGSSQESIDWIDSRLALYRKLFEELSPPEPPRDSSSPTASKIHIELDRSELCPSAKYAVQWQGVLVGYERMEDAEAAFEATQGNMAKGEELNLVILTQVKHFVAPGATRAVAEESQPHVEAEKDPVR